MSSNSQQFTIKASDETLKHNLLKINGPIVNLESIPSISISRLVETTEEDTDESKLDIKVGGVKFDASKVAPSAAALKKVNYFQKKNRQFFYGRERGQGDDKDDGIEGISLSQKKTKDPDTLPYIMTTNNNHVYEGSLEDQTSSYMLFIAQDSGFKAIPLSKYYKFNQKTTYNRLTIEEAELRLNGSKRKQELGQDRWFMKSHQKEDGQEDVVPIKVEKKFKIADSGGNAEDEELDFEEDFQDDGKFF